MSAPRRVAPEPSRRGWCPSLAQPMPTGDGLLARVHPPSGVLSPAQARTIAEAARRWGNGHVDVTARANLQIRGVSEATAAPLAARLAAAGLGDVRSDGGPQRLTLTAPLVGPDVAALARAVEAAGLAIPGLPAKAIVTIEEAAAAPAPGSPSTDAPATRTEGAGLAGTEADLRIVATARGRVALALAGSEWFGGIEAGEVPAIVGAALRMLAGSGRRRMRDVAPEELERFAAGLGLVPGAAPVPAEDLAPGLARLPDGRTVLLLDAPFGRLAAGGLDRLADRAQTMGSAIHLAPSRGFALVGSAEAAERARDDLAPLFITGPHDPRSAVAACPGAPACASGSTPTPADAARLADAFAPFAARGLTAHVSGCAKGCAHPGSAPLTLVARDGLYGIVLHGRPDALPAMRLTFEAALERVRRAGSMHSKSFAGSPADALAYAFRTAP